ncbi:MAG: hypothetical protein Q9157_003242 [Trypethelium eluteriae]
MEESTSNRTPGLRGTLRSLLDLPTEIRKHIYELVLCTNDVSPVIERNNMQLQQPPLTRCCRLIRAESLDVFYTKNDFHTSIYKRHICNGVQFVMCGFTPVWIGDELMLWLSMIGEDNVKRLRTIVFWGVNLGARAHFTTGDRFRLSHLEEAKNDSMEGNIISSHSTAFQAEINCLETSSIMKSTYICWIRDKLVDLPSHKEVEKASRPKKAAKRMKTHSVLRFDIMTFLKVWNGKCWC